LLKKKAKNKDSVLLQSVLCGGCENTKTNRITKRHISTRAFLVHLYRCKSFDHLTVKGRKTPSKTEIFDAIKKAQIKFRDDEVPLEKIFELSDWGMLVR